MTQIPKVRLRGGLEICRILNGLWQVSGAHGKIDPHQAVQALEAYVNAGLTSFDMADIYGPAEEIYGSFYKQLLATKGHEAVKGIQGLTKWIPQPGPMTRKVVESAIDLSLQRMQVSHLDCLQFHWWDYSDKRYLDALGHLSDLQTEGKINELSLTNFDTEHVVEITNKGIQISSIQLQYSVVDRRPMVKMTEVCEALGIKLLTYGTLGGGFISEKYLGAKEPKNEDELYTSSLKMYKKAIDTWGGWDLFQELLQVLSSVAKSHNCTIANVATKYILDMPAVAGIIIGCRMGIPGAEHIQENVKSFDVHLTTEDTEMIESVLKKSSDLMQLIGDCGDEYRLK